jgi:hypothetical protein
VTLFVFGVVMDVTRLITLMPKLHILPNPETVQTVTTYFYNILFNIILPSTTQAPK